MDTGCLRFPIPGWLLIVVTGCSGVYPDPVQSLGVQWCRQAPGGMGKGVLASVEQVVGAAADGFGLGFEVAVSGEEGAAAGALGVSFSSGPDLFYLLSGHTTPGTFQYIAPWVGLGAGLVLSAGGVEAYGELSAEVCIFVPQVLRLRAGYAWGLSGPGGYQGFRMGIEWLF